MSYTISTILGNDYIGNSLSAVNRNYSTLDIYTNNIQFSSEKYFKPLADFYTFYGDFWKDSINYAYSINALSRLSSFQTTVLENSAKWIKPITFYYPVITEYTPSNINTTIDDAIEWFKIKYPIFNTNSTVPNFVENTTVFINCIFYQKNLKVDTKTTNISASYCSTSDTTATASCWVKFVDNIACYSDRHACGKFSKTVADSPTSPSCFRTFNMTCDYENGANDVTRLAIFNITNYFEDRYENDDMISIVLKLKNCEWTYIKTI